MPSESALQLALKNQEEQRTVVNSTQLVQFMPVLWIDDLHCLDPVLAIALVQSLFLLPYPVIFTVSERDGLTRILNGTLQCVLCPCTRVSVAFFLFLAPALHGTPSMSGSGIAARFEVLKEFPTMSRSEMVTALMTPANKYRLMLHSEDESVLGVPFNSFQVFQDAADCPLCAKKDTAERLVDLLGDDMTSLDQVLDIASRAGSQPGDESLRTFLQPIFACSALFAFACVIF